MAKAVAARQFGDEYQQLVFWKYALRMLSGNYEIENIKYEDESVKSFDDVVIEYAKPQIFRDTTISKEYIQVKFHMRDDGLFTVDNLLDPAFINADKNSLLDNVVAAYKKLGDEFVNSTFVIYSTWDVAQDDILYELISNVDRTIELEKLFDGKTERSKMGKIRKKMCKALDVSEVELKCILRQIRLESRQETLGDLKNNLNRSMESLGLQVISGSKYANTYTQLIQELNKSGHISFSKAFLEEQLCNEGLYSYKRNAEYSQQDSGQMNTQATEKQIDNPFTFIQNGANSTQIGYVNQLSINYNGYCTNYLPPMVNNQYYNLFVVEQDSFDGYISIPRKNALDDYTDMDIRKIFAKPKLAALNEIKQLPSLFLSRNMFGNRTSLYQKAGIGYVIDAKEFGDVIRIAHSNLQPISQQYLNEIAEELLLKTSPERNELDVVHWSIKRADLLHILKL